MVPFKKLEYETCWEYINCPFEMRKNCIVYKTDMKKPCWVLNQTRKSAVLNACKTCPWFLKNNKNYNKK